MSENAIETSLRLRTIYSLLGESFLIPSYQRGFRWSAQEVTQLLDDILAFSIETDLGSFYCLQPIVVRSQADAETNATSWEVLDGQQRLTTIKIILKVIASDVIRRSISEEYGVPEFSIEYETRPRSAEFIENISPDQSNIDFAHMWNAYEATQNWFSAKGRSGNVGTFLASAPCRCGTYLIPAAANCGGEALQRSTRSPGGGAWRRSAGMRPDSLRK